MFHSEWKGTHYQAGWDYGNFLYKEKVNPMDNIPPFSDEMREFTLQSLPIYEKYYPEILQEIKGFAVSLQVNYLDIACFLFSMYCFVFDNKCSCLAVADQEQVYLARNSDFSIDIEDLCDNVHYSLFDGYAFLGNTTAWTQIEDGINEYGLAVGLTFIYPTKIKPGINAGLMVRFLLEKCRTVNEAIEMVHTLPIASAQTLTLADRTGQIAVVECNCEKVNIRQQKEGYVFATNHFISEPMIKYQWFGEDDIHSHERYETMEKALGACKEYSTEFLMELLSGKLGFMCQYDRAKGMDTVWSSIYDVSHGIAYLAEGNPSRNPFQIDKHMAV